MSRSVTAIDYLENCEPTWYFTVSLKGGSTLHAIQLAALCQYLIFRAVAIKEHILFCSKIFAVLNKIVFSLGLVVSHFGALFCV